MNGYVANTDYDWFTFLAAHAPLEEVNFWQPSGGNANFRVVGPGEPFFFKLKAPRNVIAGFGWFARHERQVRASLAWEAFGIGNGAPTLASMRSRIESYIAPPNVRPGRDYPVGCLMIAQPVFFPQSGWIEQPSDWSKNIVSGKGYDVTVGEGRRIFEACLAQVGPAAEFAGHVPASFAADLAAGATTLRDIGAPRYGEPTFTRPRLGQGIFRVALNGAYEGACAVTGEHSWPVLEAAHIKPYAEDGDHQIDNGLLLRADIHKLFDKGYVTITPDHRFEVSRRLREDWENGRAYYKRQGDMIRLPKRIEDRPAKAMLEWHNAEVFLG